MSIGTLPSMQPEEFRLLRDFVNQATGLYLADGSEYIVERRLKDRLLQLSLADFRAYYQYLRYHPRGVDELAEAVERLVTNETYFFRELPQLRAFADELLPALAAQNKASRRLSIWSAGCSTGEEAYTLAALVERSRLFVGWDVRIIGTDISRRVLTHARRAAYGRSSFRAVPPEFDNCFLPQDAASLRRVQPALRAMCQFGHVNLVDRDRTIFVGRVDVVFCRNVLIYFDTASRRAVTDMFYERLVPGGTLFLGHSESLLHVSTAFDLVHFRTDMGYRKPLSGAPPSLSNMPKSRLQLAQHPHAANGAIETSADGRRLGPTPRERSEAERQQAADGAPTASAHSIGRKKGRE